MPGIQLARAPCQMLEALNQSSNDDAPETFEFEDCKVRHGSPQNPKPQSEQLQMARAPSAVGMPGSDFSASLRRRFLHKVSRRGF